MIQGYIKEYLEYLSKKEEYKMRYNRDFSLLEEDLNRELKNISFEELVNLYLDKSGFNGYFRNSNTPFLIEKIHEMIIARLPEVSILNIVEVYIKVFSDTLKVQESMTSNNNLIKASHDKGALKEEDLYMSYSSFYKQSFLAKDQLQNELFSYIVEIISKLDELEREKLFSYYNDLIISNCKEMERRINFRNNKYAVDLHIRFHPKSLFQLYEELDTTILENSNYVYDSLKGMLKERVEKRDR